jgi:hypothetical protein
VYKFRKMKCAFVMCSLQPQTCYIRVCYSWVLLYIKKYHNRWWNMSLQSWPGDQVAVIALKTLFLAAIPNVCYVFNRGGMIPSSSSIMNVSCTMGMLHMVRLLTNIMFITLRCLRDAVHLKWQELEYSVNGNFAMTINLYIQLSLCSHWNKQCLPQVRHPPLISKNNFILFSRLYACLCMSHFPIQWTSQKYFIPMP